MAWFLSSLAPTDEIPNAQFPARSAVRGSPALDARRTAGVGPSAAAPHFPCCRLPPLLCLLPLARPPPLLTSPRCRSSPHSGAASAARPAAPHSMLLRFVNCYSQFLMDEQLQLSMKFPVIAGRCQPCPPSVCCFVSLAWPCHDPSWSRPMSV